MKYIIVDIDGTLANGDHRVRHLEKSPKDWDAYFQTCGGDSPIESICRLVRKLATCYDAQIVYCTGRREDCRSATENWLSCNGLPINVRLLMRADGDHRHDTEVKPELLRNAAIPFDDIWLILEDRNSMVKKWRELGLTCLQVAEGDF